jgi:dCMP deaminase
MKTGELVKDANSCAMCKKIIINAGIEQVIIRDTHDSYRYIDVQDWIDNDETLVGEMGY